MTSLEIRTRVCKLGNHPATEDEFRIGSFRKLQRNGKKYLSDKRRIHHDCKKCVKLLAQMRTVFIRSFKTAPCMDCGHSFHHYQMDFDHVRGVKLFALSTVNKDRRNRSFDEIFSEISKCDVVCSNCHRARTWARLTENTHEQRNQN
jgi:hypothetical protein